MKKIIAYSLVLGAMVFAAGKASAFPLKLTSLSAQVAVTPSFNAIETNGVPTTNVANIKLATFDLKKIMLVVSNQTFSDYNVIVPADSYLTWDPYSFSSSLTITNNSGFSTSYNNSHCTMEDMATSFKGKNDGSGSEADSIRIYLDIRGYAADGKYYQVQADDGSGTLAASVSSDATGNMENMTVSCKNSAGSGEIASSDSGVTTSIKFTFSGSGSGEALPYSTIWYNDWY